MIALWAAQRFGSAFPHGTLIVNLIGCFAIAALMHAALTLGWPPTVRAAATISFAIFLGSPIDGGTPRCRVRSSIEVVDDQVHLDRLLPILDEMITKVLS